MLGEAPEGLPKGVEGGSCGSGDAPGPVEAVPLEPSLALPPPPPEAPVLDEALGGPPNGVEDGSCGSGDAPPPPEALVEAVPLVPPPMHEAEAVKQTLAEAPARLEPEAYVTLEHQFIAVARLEDLREEDRKAYEAVRDTGLGVCSRCRWYAGCHSCDEAKAWGYYCRSTLWHTASEVVRPKAKPRGRPKKEPAAKA